MSLQFLILPASLLGHLILTCLVLTFARPLQFNVPRNPDGFRNIACMTVLVAQLYMTAIWIGLGPGARLLRLAEGASLAMTSWLSIVLYLHLSESFPYSNGVNDSPDIMLAVKCIMSAVIWLLTCAILLILRIFSRSRWIIAQSEASSAQHRRPRSWVSTLLTWTTVLGATAVNFLILKEIMQLKWYSGATNLALIAWAQMAVCSLVSAVVIVLLTFTLVGLFLTNWAQRFWSQRATAPSDRGANYFLISVFVLGCLATLLLSPIDWGEQNEIALVVGFICLILIAQPANSFWLLRISGYRCRLVKTEAVANSNTNVYTPSKDDSPAVQGYSRKTFAVPAFGLLCAAAIAGTMFPTGRISRLVILNQASGVARNAQGQVISLDLSGASLRNSVRHLTAYRHLRSVDLYNTDFADSDLKYVAKLGELERLGLGRTDVTDAGIRDLYKLSKLDSLDLRATGISDEGVADLRGLQNVRAIDLSQTAISDQACAYLSEMPQLQMVGLRVTNIGDSGIQHLADLAKLKILRLRSTKVTDVGVQYLASWKQLQQVELANTVVTEVGVEHLAKLPNLKRLDLSGTEVDAASLGTLAKMKDLQWLALSSTAISREEVEDLRTLLPDCKVDYVDYSWLEFLLESDAEGILRLLRK